MTEESNKPRKGYWESLSNERTPKVTFEINVPQVVTFKCDDPREDESEDGKSVYYTFDVVHNGKETVIQTSAFTLLGELKKQGSLRDRSFSIVKKSDKGKQYFIVTAI